MFFIHRNFTNTLVWLGKLHQEVNNTTFTERNQKKKNKEEIAYSNYYNAVMIDKGLVSQTCMA